MARSSKLVYVSGADSILEKLDARFLVRPGERRLFNAVAEVGKRELLARVPRLTGASAGQIAASAQDISATITAPRYPLVFLERGSQYPGTGRQHRRRGPAPAGGLRIKPRRFLARTRARIRRELPALVNELKNAVEQAWGSG